MNGIHTSCTTYSRCGGVCRCVTCTRRTPDRQCTGGAATLAAGADRTADAASGTATPSPMPHSTAATGLLIFVRFMSPLDDTSGAARLPVKSTGQAQCYDIFRPVTKMAQI